MRIVREDPDIAAWQASRRILDQFWFMFAFEPIGERTLSADKVIARLRPKLYQGGRRAAFLQAVQEIRAAAARAIPYSCKPCRRCAARTLHLGARSCWRPGAGIHRFSTGVDSDQAQTAAGQLVIDRDAMPRPGSASQAAAFIHSSTMPSASARYRHRQALNQLPYRHEGLRPSLGESRIAEGTSSQHDRRRDQRRPATPPSWHATAGGGCGRSEAAVCATTSHPTR